jgi:hypothetical protein
VSAPRTGWPDRGAIALATLLAVLAAAPAPAQVPAQAPDTATAPAPKRGGGFWMDAGAGYGWLRLTSGQNLLNGQRLGGVVAAHGMAVTISAGGSVAHNVLLGAQYQTWSAAGGGAVDQRVRSLLAIVQWYPWAGMGLYVRAGTGIVQGPVEPDAASAATAQGTGVGFTLGVGYDFPVSRHLGLAVQTATHIAAFGNVTAGGQVSHDVIGYVTRIGVAVVYR